MSNLSSIIPDLSRILVYGTGYYYSLLSLYLELTGNGEKIAALSSSDINEERVIDGYPAYPIEKCKCEDYGAVIIAISPMKSAGIRDLLVGQCFENIYQMDIDDRDFLIEYLKSIPLQKNKVLFDCYDGMGYRCNCKYVAKYILDHCLPIEIIWRYKGGTKADFPEKIKSVKVNTKEYVYDLYTSAILISNLCFGRVRPDQYAICLWHGTGPFKKAGAAQYEFDEKKKMDIRKASLGVDLWVSNSCDNTKMFREDFYHEGEIGEWGSPRNDIILYPGNTRDKMKELFGIQENQKVVLYIPTFREDIASSKKSYDLDFELILQTLGKRFDCEFVLMYRLHHLLKNDSEFGGIQINGIDVSDYDDTQELLILADVLITDYSSVMWDFSLMKKPVFLYHNDVDKYIEDRGFYWPPEEWPYPKGHTQEEMDCIIDSFDKDDYLMRLNEFFHKDPSYDDAHACERVVQRIMDVIEQK